MRKEWIKKIPWQRFLIALSIMIVCLNTRVIQTTAWNSGFYEACIDSMGILMAVILMTNYRLKDFKKHSTIYLVWTVFGFAGAVIGAVTGIRSRLSFLKADTIVLDVAFFLMGYCVIHTVLDLIAYKRHSKLYLPLFIVFLLMFLLMFFSRSDFLWPYTYFVMFLCYYLTDQSKEQRRDNILGILNGLILGFLAVQGHSLLVRPFDLHRYYGNFSNPNHNSMFLCMCLAGILGRILVAVKEKEKLAFRILLFLMAGVDLAFIFMTACRSGYLAAATAVLFFAAVYCKTVQKKVFFRLGLLFLLLFAAELPLTYLAVRYIPTIRPHVRFYYNDPYSLDRVHSYDPADSPKYITFEEMIGDSVGRIGNTVRQIFNRTSRSNFEAQKVRLSASAPVLAAGGKVPALKNEDETNTFLIRYTIYKWYFDHLTFRGMPYEEQGFQLTETHWIQDTHDIYLDYGINFGYPVMILFAVFLWWGMIRVTKRGIGQKDSYALASVLVLLMPAVFGIFEYAWGPGKIATVAFYLCFREILTSAD